MSDEDDMIDVPPWGMFHIEEMSKCECTKDFRIKDRGENYVYLVRSEKLYD